MQVFVSLLSAGSGGAINYARYLPPLLSSELNARGDRLTVLAYEGLLDSNSFGRGGNNKLIEIPHRSGPARLVWEYLHMDSLLSKLAPDIVFYPHQVSPRIKQIPSVLMIRNMEPFAFQEYPSPIKKKLRNLALREATKQSCSRASHVVCVSQYVRDYARLYIL